jgi:hypothetical protein
MYKIFFIAFILSLPPTGASALFAAALGLLQIGVDLVLVALPFLVAESFLFAHYFFE